MPTNGYINSKHTCVLTQFCRRPGIAQDHDDMEFMTQKLKEEYEKCGLTMNLEQTKYVCIGDEKESLNF